MRGMQAPPFTCFKCRNRFTVRPADAQQDDVCARCLHDLRCGSGVEQPREPAPCDPDLVAFRDHIEHGPIPPWGFTTEDFERALREKLDASTQLEDHPSDGALRRYRVAERGLQRIRDENMRRVDLAHVRRHGASA